MKIACALEYRESALQGLRRPISGTALHTGHLPEPYRRAGRTRNRLTINYLTITAAQAFFNAHLRQCPKLRQHTTSCPECGIRSDQHSIKAAPPAILPSYPNERSGHVISGWMKLSGSNIFWKNALAGLQEAVFLKPDAPRSVFLWRLGCSMFRIIDHAGRCRADFAKLVAPRFSAPHCQLCHCHQPESSIITSRLGHEEVAFFWWWWGV